MPTLSRHERCILCGGLATPFFELSPVPVNVSQLFHDADEARRAPTGRLALAFCHSCGGIFNAAWDPVLLTYGTDYENSLDASAVFDRYAESLARRLAAAYDLQGATVVEIGCGQARFLERLCSVTGGKGLGFDPSYIGEPGVPHVTVQRRLFEASDAAGARIILCRHVLEHLENPREFIASLAAAGRGNDDAVVYFEVPNAASIFEGGIPWDLIYPHISYFTMESLGRLFTQAGFRVLASGTSYSDQFLYLEAKLVDATLLETTLPSGSHANGARGTERMERVTTSFSGLLDSIVREWAAFLAGARRAGTRVAFWGAGAKGITFLNAVPGARDIRAVVDINPRKHGSYVPGTGQFVDSPGSLHAFDPEVVIVSNPIYIDEIRKELAGLRVGAAVITVPENLAQAV
jgi:hypothetical protein